MSKITGQLDHGVVRMVEFFNLHGLPTSMSCEGHNKTNMSMFWIEFDKTVTEDDILSFMKKHLDYRGVFISNGRFANRVIGFFDVTTNTWAKRNTWCYFAATKKAADGDLNKWLHDTSDFDGLDGDRYAAWKEHCTSIKML